MKKIVYGILLMALWIAACKSAQQQSGGTPQAPIIFKTTADMMNYQGSYVYSLVSDTVTVGTFFLQKNTSGFGIFRNSTYVIDSGIVFPSAKPGYVWVRDLSQSTAINLRWYGAKGDSITDNAPALRKAREMVYKVGFTTIYIPNGKYLFKDTVVFSKGATFLGENWDSTILIRDHVAKGSNGILSFFSNSVNEQIKGIQIRNLCFQGNTVKLGYQAFTHLLTLHGTDGVIVDHCKFLEMRGDGIYLGAGPSSTDSTKFRYNKNFTLTNSYFDGGSGTVFKNRNGLSIIDCDGVNVYNNYFRHIGNNNLSSSVGAIDFERNNSWNYVKTSNIENNIFDSINTVNTAAITLHAANMPPYYDQADFVNITGNEFKRCYFGIEGVAGQTREIRMDRERASVNITNNNFKYTISFAIRSTQMRSVNITRNFFKGNGQSESNIVVGVSSSVAEGDVPSTDIEIGYNSFDSIGGSGIIEIGSVRGLNIHDNIMNVRSGTAGIYFYSDLTIASRRKMDLVRIVNNRFQAIDNSPIGGASTYFIRGLAPFNQTNFFINSTCELRDNYLGNRTKPQQISGDEYYFNKQTVSAPPTQGSWETGNELYSAAGTTGSYRLLCVKGGTFGTDSYTNSLAATNGSNYFAYDSVASGRNITFSHLREGQWVSITGSTKAYKIITIKDTTGFYTDISYDGTTGTATAQWTPPSWVNVPVNFNYVTQATTATKKVGNISQYYEGVATAARTLTLGNDTTTLPGVRFHFTNKNTGAFDWTITPESGVTIDGGTASIVLSQNQMVDLINTGVNQWKVFMKQTVGIP